MENDKNSGNLCEESDEKWSTMAKEKYNGTKQVKTDRH